MLNFQNYFKSFAALVFTLLAINSFAQVNFNDYFFNKTLRFDYLHNGNSTSETINFQQLKDEPYWGGSQKNLIDIFNYGEYMYFVYDSATSKLIFSKGYSTLFGEYQTTTEAKTISKAMYETITFPFPRNTIKLEIKRRNKKQILNTIYETYINPYNYFISKEKAPDCQIEKIITSGNSTNCFDIVFISEGYTKNQMKKFVDDVKKFSKTLLSVKPFSDNKTKINIWAVEAISQEEGTDIPGSGVWKNTVLNSSFYTFDTERYLTTFDTKSVRDYASNVPYDQIVILVNSSKYGGGGFYNHYSLFSSDDFYSQLVFIHEFGHGFTGLADEYYTSNVAYENFYDLTVEPYEPNITTLVDFDKKWKNMLDKGTPIPTPQTDKYLTTLGVFEGGGYNAKGIYRPKQSCIMKDLIAKDYCPVCLKATLAMFNFYCD